MGAIIYYIPGASAVSRAGIEKAGLGYTLPKDTGTPEYTTTQKGPDGAFGALFLFQGKDKVDLVQLAQETKWEQIPHTKCWFGYDKNNPPKPQDLKRVSVRESYAVMLSDGNKWDVPIIRHVDNTTELPKQLKHDGEKWLAVSLRPEHLDLFERAGQVWDEYITPLMETDDSADDDEAIEISLTNGWDFAVDALALNYRISIAEVSLLGLFDSTTASQAALAAIDWFTWCDYDKKKSADLKTQDSNAGGPVE